MFLLCALLALGQAAQVAPGPRKQPGAPPIKLAVMDVRLGPELEPALGPFLTQVLASEVGERTRSAPLVSADIRALLGFEKAKRSLGCDEASESCVAELAGALGVDQVVHASVAVAGGQYLVTVTRLDSHRAQPLGRFAAAVARDHEALVHELRVAAFTLFGGAPPAPLAQSLPAQPGSTSGDDAAAHPRSARRTWAWVAGGAAVALAATGAGVGASALSAARAQNADPARTRAHLADGLYLGAAAAAGTALWLWFGGSAPPATVAAAASTHGATIQLAGTF